MVENINLTMPNVGNDGQIDRWMIHSKDLSNWEHMVKSMVLRDRPNTSSNNEENDDDDDDDDVGADEDNDEGVEGSRNEPTTQAPP